MPKLDLQRPRFTFSNGSTIEFEPADASAYVSSEHAYMLTEIAPFTTEQYEVLAARLVAITKPQDTAETNIVA